MQFKRVILLAALLATFAGTGCQRAMKTQPEPAAVIAEHSNELMSLPDVVGVYESLMPDGKTHCIKVMLSQDNPNTVKQLPSSLDGYPVVSEITGPVRPLAK